MSVTVIHNYVICILTAEGSRKLMRESWKKLEEILDGCVKIQEITDVKQQKHYVNVMQG
jgi:hypothetical protein